jgi:hypothetical protein
MRCVSARTSSSFGRWRPQLPNHILPPTTTKTMTCMHACILTFVVVFSTRLLLLLYNTVLCTPYMQQRNNDNEKAISKDFFLQYPRGSGCCPPTAMVVAEAVARVTRYYICATVR